MQFSTLWFFISKPISLKIASSSFVTKNMKRSLNHRLLYIWLRYHYCLHSVYFKSDNYRIDKTIIFLYFFVFLLFSSSAISILSLIFIIPYGPIKFNDFYSYLLVKCSITSHRRISCVGRQKQNRHVDCSCLLQQKVKVFCNISEARTTATQQLFSTKYVFPIYVSAH